MMRQSNAFGLAWIVLAVANVHLFAANPSTTSDSATNLARELETAVQKGDASAAASLLDMDKFLDRTMNGVSAPADFAAGFRQGAKKSFSLVTPIFNAVKDGGSYRLLRVRNINGESRALCRLLTKEGGLNYNDWVVAKNAQGKAVFEDVYVAATGEMVSQTVRRIYVATAVQANPGWLDRLTGKDKDYATNLNAMVRLSNDIQAGNYEDALDAYRKMPTKMQQDKTLLVLRISAAVHLQDTHPDEYEAAIAELERLYPGDPSLDLMSIDHLVTTKKFEEARKSIARLEAFTGGDAYLQYLRGNMYLMEGGDKNLAEAKKQFRASINTEPTLHAPYWGLVSESLKSGHFKETASMLDEIQRKLHLNIGGLEKIPDYAEFVKSAEYKQWKAKQKPQ